MSETKKMAQWFLWFMTFMVLLVEVNLLGSPLAAKILIKGDINPIGDIFDWKIWILFLIGFSTLVWWLGRGQYYQSRNRLAPAKWRKEFPNHCPVIQRTMEGLDVGPCWSILRGGICPTHGRIYKKADSK